MKPVRLFLIFLAVSLISLIGCQSNTYQLTQTPIAPDIIQPPSSSPTPPTCTHNSPNPTLQVIVGTLRKDVRNTLFQNIQIEGQGFSPGEVVDLIVEGRGINHTSQLEIPHFQVKEDGHFSNPESLQMDEPKMSWQVFVIHQHGVACTNFSTNPAGTPDPTPLTAAPDGPV